MKFAFSGFLIAATFDRLGSLLSEFQAYYDINKKQWTDKEHYQRDYQWCWGDPHEGRSLYVTAIPINIPEALKESIYVLAKREWDEDYSYVLNQYEEKPIMLWTEYKGGEFEPSGEWIEPEGGYSTRVYLDFGEEYGTASVRLDHWQ